MQSIEIARDGNEVAPLCIHGSPYLFPEPERTHDLVNLMISAPRNLPENLTIDFLSL